MISKYQAPIIKTDSNGRTIVTRSPSVMAIINKNPELYNFIPPPWEELTLEKFLEFSLGNGLSHYENERRYYQYQKRECVKATAEKLDVSIQTIALAYQDLIGNHLYDDYLSYVVEQMQFLDVENIIPRIDYFSQNYEIIPYKKPKQFIK